MLLAQAWAESSWRTDAVSHKGAVGVLQFEVLASRLEQEYGVSARLEAAPYETARWITSDKPDEVARFCATERSSIADERWP